MFTNTRMYLQLHSYTNTRTCTYIRMHIKKKKIHTKTESNEIGDNRPAR